MSAKEVREALDEQLNQYAEVPEPQDFIDPATDTARLVDGKVITDPSNDTALPEQPGHE